MRTDLMLQFDIKYIIFCLCICLLYKIFNKENNKIQIIDIVTMCILVVVSALRCNVGSDYVSYYLRYNSITNVYSGIKDIIINSNSVMFDILAYIVKIIVNNEYAIFWVVALIIYPCLIIVLRKNFKKPYIGLAVYLFMGFYSISNNIIKQYLAMCLILISYKYLISRKKLKFIFIVIIASLFHSTALIAALLIILSTKIKANGLSLVIANFIGVTCFMFFDVFITIFEKYIPYNYYIYIQNNYGSMIKQTIGVIGYVIIYNLIIIILLRKKDVLKINNINIAVLIIAIPVNILAIQCWPISRVCLYLYQFIIFIAPKLLDYNYEKNNLRKNVVFFYLLMIIWMGFINIFGSDNEYYNYTTYYQVNPTFPRDIF